jgi:hypothetical protein
MKKMKLFYGVLIGLMILSSCSNNDSNSETNVDSISIVGIWKPIKRVTICSTGNQESENFDSCVQNGKLIYEANGNFNEDTYSLNNSNACNLVTQENGTWRIENDKLNIKYSDDNAFEEVPFFELSENILRIGEYTNSGSCDDGNLESHYYFEYERIQ